MDPNSSQPPAVPPIKSSANLDEILDSLENQIASTPPAPGPSQVPSPLSSQANATIPVESPIPVSIPTPVVETKPVEAAPPIEVSSPLTVDAKQFEMEEKPLASAQPVETPASSAPIATASLKEDPTFPAEEKTATVDTATPVKKGFQLPFAFNPKVAVATFGLFIALVGGVAAYFLQTTNQDIRQQASSGNVGCTNDTDNCAIGSFKCTNNVSYECIQYSVYCNSNQGVWRSGRGNACAVTPPTTPPTGGGGGANYQCQNGNQDRDQAKVLVCNCGNACTYRSDNTQGGGGAGWVCEQNCTLQPIGSRPTTQCGQVDYVHQGTSNYCGVVQIYCDGSCQGSTSTPPPTAPPTPTPPPVTLTPPACGTVCTTEALCDSFAIKLVPKYISTTRLYAVIDKVTLGDATLVEETATSLSYGGTWTSYGPAAVYAGGTVKIKYAGALASGTSPSVNFFVNGPSFDVYTDKGPNRSGYDVYINGVKQASTALDNLLNTGDGNANNVANYIAYKATITVPGYDATKYTCATVGTAKACRLTTNPTSTTCSPATATPTPSPTPSAPPLACLNISKDVASPVLGSTVRFTCGQVAGVTKYEFRYKVGANGATQTLASSTASSNVSLPLTITGGGTYKVQCRPCVGTACTNWESNW